MAYGKNCLSNCLLTNSAEEKGLSMLDDVGSYAGTDETNN